jgi:hypothetical protein
MLEMLRSAPLRLELLGLLEVLENRVIRSAPLRLELLGMLELLESLMASWTWLCVRGSLMLSWRWLCVQ